MQELSLQNSLQSNPANVDENSQVILVVSVNGGHLLEWKQLYFITKTKYI